MGAGGCGRKHSGVAKLPKPSGRLCVRAVEHAQSHGPSVHRLCAPRCTAGPKEEHGTLIDQVTRLAAGCRRAHVLVRRLDGGTRSSKVMRFFGVKWAHAAADRPERSGIGCRMNGDERTRKLRRQTA